MKLGSKIFNVTLLLSFILLLTTCETKEKKNEPIKSKEIGFVIPNISTVSHKDIKAQITEYFVKKLKIEPTYFDTATVDNTDLLRELVHLTNYKNNYDGRPSKRYRLNELGYMFKGDGVGGKCGFMGSTLYDIYRSLGYKVKRFDVINGALNGASKYTESHVFNEVYIPSLKKWIVQDPTINNSFYSCKNQERLSLNEVIKDYYINDLKPCLSNTNLSPEISENGKKWIHSKTLFIGNYYEGTIVSYKKFDGLKESAIDLEPFSVKLQKDDLNAETLNKLCEDCELEEDIKCNNTKLLKFMNCLNSKIQTHALVINSIDSEETSLLIQYTNNNGKNWLYNPLKKIIIKNSYFNYSNRDIKRNRNLLNKDKKYYFLVKLLTLDTKEVLEF